MRRYILEALAKEVGAKLQHPLKALFDRECSNPACVICHPATAMQVPNVE